MRVIVATSGTRGDVQPALALAVGLRSAGHEVLLIAPPENRNWATQFKCPFQGMGMDYMATVARYSHGLDLEAYRQIIPLLRRQLRIQLEELPRLVQGADVVVAVSLMIGAYSVAETFGIPCLCVATTPQLLPSRHHPPLEINCQRLPAWANWTAFKLSALNSNLLLKGPINHYRRANGLAPIRSLVSHILQRPILVASDPQIAPVPGDVVRPTHHLGHFHLADQDPLPEHVFKFIHAGSPPVYIGFGSMGEDWSRIIPMAREAARQARCRAIFVQGSGQIDEGMNGSDFLVTGPLSHGQLFPRMAAVAHHGGAGTTATAARAGVPQIIVPHLLDQFFWAKHIHDLGLGPKGIPQSKLNSRNLSAAIQRCLGYPGYGRRARTMARRLENQDGVPDAIEMIESLGRGMGGIGTVTCGSFLKSHIPFRV